MNLDWTELLKALGLVMVIEGLLPFAVPTQWRRMLLSMSQLSSRNVRVIGLLSLCCGVLLLQVL
jgi:uncharacterized protein YjeT (DUF2065 family)